MAKNIVLVGLMGSGKTTVAQFISEKTGKNLSNIDDLIELGAQKSISEFWSSWKAFRKFESKIIENLAFNQINNLNRGEQLKIWEYK